MSRKDSIIFCCLRFPWEDVDDQNADNEVITEKFRSIVPKKYGAAYYPFLQTALQHRYVTVIVDSFSRNGQALSAADAANAVIKKYTDAVKKLNETKAKVSINTSIMNVVEKAHTANNAINIADILLAAKKKQSA